MIPRALATKIISAAKKFPAVVISGPRQSGKTTLARALFPKKPYVLLEDPDTMLFAQDDPRGFLARFPDGAVLDEVQKAPHLFSYLQGILDESDQCGRFVLTGSQNYLMMEKVSQSLAGRVAVFELLPFSLGELRAGGFTFSNPQACVFGGGYPRRYDKDISAYDFYANYVRTYVERDVRQLKNVHDLSVFHRFLKMCAQRVGQIVNFSSLAEDCGITHNTAKAWISLLETSYIVYLLKPYHRNLNKRLVKSPKMYFYDAGLACYLAGIESSTQLETHALKGGMFESFIVSELLKMRFAQGKDSNLFFWRDQTGREIDIVVEKGSVILPVEVKAGQTFNPDFCKHLTYFKTLAHDVATGFVVYGGEKTEKRKDVQLVAWRDLDAELGRLI